MTSPRQIRANRVNAKASTGPKTRMGKLRAAQNARRHGLSISIFADPARAAELTSLALEIAGGTTDPCVLEAARRVAEAQLDLVRIRHMRHDFLAYHFSSPNFVSNEFGEALDAVLDATFAHLKQFGPDTPVSPELAQAADDLFHWKSEGPWKLEGAEKFAHILSDHAKRLFALDRYERRALSRRKFAIRELAALRRQTAS
jgi:hypothetical protein